MIDKFILFLPVQGGKSALSVAVDRDAVEIVKFLLTMKLADPDIKNAVSHLHVECKLGNG